MYHVNPGASTQRSRHGQHATHSRLTRQNGDFSQLSKGPQFCLRASSQMPADSHHSKRPTTPCLSREDLAQSARNLQLVQLFVRDSFAGPSCKGCIRQSSGTDVSSTVLKWHPLRRFSRQNSPGRLANSREDLLQKCHESREDVNNKANALRKPCLKRHRDRHYSIKGKHGRVHAQEVIQQQEICARHARIEGCR